MCPLQPAFSFVPAVQDVFRSGDSLPLVQLFSTLADICTDLGSRTEEQLRKGSRLINLTGGAGFSSNQLVSSMSGRCTPAVEVNLPLVAVATNSSGQVWISGPSEGWRQGGTFELKSGQQVFSMTRVTSLESNVDFTCPAWGANVIPFACSWFGALYYAIGLHCLVLLTGLLMLATTKMHDVLSFLGIIKRMDSTVEETPKVRERRRDKQVMMSMTKTSATLEDIHPGNTTSWVSRTRNLLTRTFTRGPRRLRSKVSTQVWEDDDELEAPRNLKVMLESKALGGGGADSSRIYEDKQLQLLANAWLALAAMVWKIFAVLLHVVLLASTAGRASGRLIVLPLVLACTSLFLELLLVWLVWGTHALEVAVLERPQHMLHSITAICKVHLDLVLPTLLYRHNCELWKTSVFMVVCVAFVHIVAPCLALAYSLLPPRREVFCPDLVERTAALLWRPAPVDCSLAILDTADPHRPEHLPRKMKCEVEETGPGGLRGSIRPVSVHNGASLANVRKSVLELGCEDLNQRPRSSIIQSPSAGRHSSWGEKDKWRASVVQQEQHQELELAEMHRLEQLAVKVQELIDDHIEQQKRWKFCKSAISSCRAAMTSLRRFYLFLTWQVALVPRRLVMMTVEEARRWRLLSLYCFLEATGCHTITIAMRSSVELAAGVGSSRLESRWVLFSGVLGGLEIAALHIFLLLNYQARLDGVENAALVLAIATTVLQFGRPSVARAAPILAKEYLMSVRNVAIFVIFTAALRLLMALPVASGCPFNTWITYLIASMTVLVLEVPAVLWCCFRLPDLIAIWKGTRLKPSDTGPKKPWHLRQLLCETLAALAASEAYQLDVVKPWAELQKKYAHKVHVFEVGDSFPLPVQAQDQEQGAAGPNPTQLPGQPEEETPGPSPIQVHATPPTAERHKNLVLQYGDRQLLLVQSRWPSAEQEHADRLTVGFLKLLREMALSFQDDILYDLINEPAARVQRVWALLEKLKSSPQPIDGNAWRTLLLEDAVTTLQSLADVLTYADHETKLAYNHLLRLTAEELYRARLFSSSVGLMASSHFRRGTLAARASMAAKVLPRSPGIWLIHWEELESLGQLPKPKDSDKLVKAEDAYAKYGEKAVVLIGLYRWRSESNPDPYRVVWRQLLTFARWYRWRWGDVEPYFWLDSCCFHEVEEAHEAEVLNLEKEAPEVDVGELVKQIRFVKNRKKDPSLRQSLRQLEEVETQRRASLASVEMEPLPGPDERPAGPTPAEADGLLPLLFATADAVVVCESHGYEDCAWLRTYLALSNIFAPFGRLIYSVDRRVVHVSKAWIMRENTELSLLEGQPSPKSQADPSSDPPAPTSPSSSARGDLCSPSPTRRMRTGFTLLTGSDSANTAQVRRLLTRFLQEVEVRTQKRTLLDPRDWPSSKLLNPARDQSRIARLTTLCLDRPPPGAPGTHGLPRPPLSFGQSRLIVSRLTVERPDHSQFHLKRTSTAHLEEQEESSSDSEEEPVQPEGELQLPPLKDRKELPWKITRAVENEEDSALAMYYGASSEQRPHAEQRKAQELEFVRPQSSASPQPRILDVSQAMYQTRKEDLLRRAGLVASGPLEPEAAFKKTVTSLMPVKFGQRHGAPSDTWHPSFHAPSLVLSPDRVSVSQLVGSGIVSTSGGVAVTAQPLKERNQVDPQCPDALGVVFEVLIQETQPRWEDGLAIGFTAQDPEKWPPFKPCPAGAMRLPRTTVCGYTGRWVVNGRAELPWAIDFNQGPWAPRTLSPGDVLTVVLAFPPSDVFRIFVNGKVVAERKASACELWQSTAQELEKTPISCIGTPLWGIVDLEGATVAVSLRAGAVGSSRPAAKALLPALPPRPR